MYSSSASRQARNGVRPNSSARGRASTPFSGRSTGPDVVTASIFVGSSALRVMDRWVAATWVPARRMWRLTITYPVINAAREVVFLATGANKANAVRHIRGGRSPLPAARVHGRHVVWLLDAAAAGEPSAPKPRPA